MKLLSFLEKKGQKEHPSVLTSCVLWHLADTSFDSSLQLTIASFPGVCTRLQSTLSLSQNIVGYMRESFFVAKPSNNKMQRAWNISVEKGKRQVRYFCSVYKVIQTYPAWWRYIFRGVSWRAKSSNLHRKKCSALASALIAYSNEPFHSKSFISHRSFRQQVFWL